MHSIYTVARKPLACLYLISLPCKLFGVEIFNENWHSFVLRLFASRVVTLGIIAELQSTRERAWIILYKRAKRDSARANGVGGICGSREVPAHTTSHQLHTHLARTIESWSRTAHACFQSHDSRGASDIIAALRSESLPIGIKSDNQAPRLRESLPRRASAPFLFVKFLTGRTSCSTRKVVDLITQSPCYMRIYTRDDKS